MILTVADMISDIRSQLEEINQDSVTDDQIIGVLNRGQRKAAGIISRRADELLLTEYTFVTDGSSEYNLPTNAFARKIDTVEVIRNGIIYLLEYASVKTSYINRSTNNVMIPEQYILKGNKIMFAPNASSGTTVRLWYPRSLDRYVKDQGSILDIDTVEGVLTLDSIGTGVDYTELNNLCYFNIIDKYTGLVKGSFCVQELDRVSNTLKIRSVLTDKRTNVMGNPILTAIPATISEEDYICNVAGTCISQLPDALIDYQIQFAILEFRRRFNEDVTAEIASLVEYENELKKAWHGKGQKYKVRMTSPIL